MAKPRLIYLDNAASTPLNEKVAQEVIKALNLYGNPSSYNDCGRVARDYMDKSRLGVARFLGAHSEEIIFTGSGTESNNLAILGGAGACLDRSREEILSTPIEHLSVLKPLEFLKKNGWKIKFARVDKKGIIDLKDFRKKLSPRTALVSVMYANNEIGTIQPITKIGKLLTDFRNQNIDTSKFRNIQHKKFPIFHVDACQATEYLDMNVKHLGVDLLTFNGSKIYGPRGLGVLYKRGGVGLSPVIFGGEQEFGLRAGTENVSAIGGLAVALENIDTHSINSGQEKEGERLVDLRDYFIEKIKTLLPDIMVNGALGSQRLPNNIHIAVPDLSSEVLLLELGKYGVCAGSGSACTSHSVEPSHVLRAIGVEKKYLDGTVRFSMGRQTTKKDMNYVLKALPKIVKDIRERYKK